MRSAVDRVHRLARGRITGICTCEQRVSPGEIAKNSRGVLIREAGFHYYGSVFMNDMFMSKAIELSIANVTRGGGPFAALVVKQGEIMASGVNQVTASNDPTAHAEIVAIREACRLL